MAKGAALTFEDCQKSVERLVSHALRRSRRDVQKPGMGGEIAGLQLAE